MLLTITQYGRSSVGGTSAQIVGSMQNIANKTPDPIPSIPPADNTRGKFGGLLYICDASLMVGDLVMAYGSTFDDGIPRRYVQRVTGMQAGPVLGVVASKTRLTVAEVIHTGTAPIFRNLAVGKRHFLAADGSLISTPLASDPMVYVHYVGLAVAEDTLMLQPSYPLLKRAST